MNLYDVRGLSLTREGVPILQNVSFHIADTGVTVVLGPSGVGKSTLVRALLGSDMGSGALSRNISPDEIFFCPQRDRLPRVLPEARLWVLDEPTRGITPAECESLREQIMRQRERGAVLLVTHDLSFARSVADQTLLLCPGDLFWFGPTQEFFDSPPTPLIERFITQGNCCPQGLLLPPHFRWVLPGRLAGMGAPGLYGELEEELFALSEAGVNLLVSLTNETPPIAKLRPLQIASLHRPIPDMGVPSLRAAADICVAIERCIAGGGAAVVHCRAGLGRTGMLLAVFLVWQGAEPSDAIDQIRNRNRGFIQTQAQLDFVFRFAREFPRQSTSIYKN